MALTILLGEGFAVMLPYIRMSYLDHIHLPPLQLGPHPRFLVILSMNKFPHAVGNTPNLPLYLVYFV